MIDERTYRFASARLMRRMGYGVTDVERLARTDPIVHAILEAATLELANAMTETRSDGPLMVPIFNQPWCPFAEEHETHVRCAECRQ